MSEAAHRHAAPMHTLVVASLLAALWPLANPLAAQRLRGRVLLPDSATAARGIIVVASDAQGRALARALTSERGDFEMSLPGAGRYTVRALRIGYRPTLVSAVMLAERETRAVRIVLNGAAIALPTVTVRGTNVCSIAKDSVEVAASLWEEARKALTASRLSMTSGRLLGHWTVYDSVSSDGTGLMDSGKTRSTTGLTDRPFISIPADSLAHKGYVQPEHDGSLVYYAPDAEVLLSDSFAELHCFRVEPPTRGHPDWVGVGFVPARERRGITDITGTVWLDRPSAELRLLELRYTPAPRAYDDATVGASLEFLRLATGDWLVNRWVIRVPRATPSPGIGAIQATGGEVTSVERGRAVIYSKGAAARPLP